MDDNRDDFYEDEEFAPPTYSGKAYRIYLRNTEKGLITFPSWNHTIILGDNSICLCKSEDLKVGMCIQSGAQVGLIDNIIEELYHGIVDGVFLGEPLEEDEEPQPHKEFKRTIFEDGSISWSLEAEKKTIDLTDIFNKLTPEDFIDNRAVICANFLRLAKLDPVVVKAIKSLLDDWEKLETEKT